MNKNTTRRNGPFMTLVVMILLALSSFNPFLASASDIPGGSFDVVNGNWPATLKGNPVVAEVANCQSSTGINREHLFFDLRGNGYEQLRAACPMAANVWTKDALTDLPAGKSFANQPATSGQNPTTNTATECASQATREARLDCASRAYFANGEGIKGYEASMTAMGITFDSVSAGPPFQPDAIPLGPSPTDRRIWGAVLNGHVKVNNPWSCLVTNVPSRIASSSNKYIDQTGVGHYLMAETAGVQDIAVHLDCSDWPEIQKLMGSTNSPAVADNQPPATNPVVPAQEQPQTVPVQPAGTTDQQTVAQPTTVPVTVPMTTTTTTDNRRFFDSVQDTVGGFADTIGRLFAGIPAWVWVLLVLIILFLLWRNNRGPDGFTVQKRTTTTEPGPNGTQQTTTSTTTTTPAP